MRLVLTGRHLEISPGLRALVDRKLVKVERVLGNAIVSAQIVLTREKDRLSAEITLHLRGDHMLAVHTTGATWQTVLSAGIEKIQRRGERVKGKWQERKRRVAPPRQAPPDGVGTQPPATAPGNGAPRVVRVTRAPVKPMSVENAALELSQSGEPFLVFRNAQTDSLSVLLRRRAGEFGLLDTGR
jgi:putative sigma-54 modulation protein